MTYYDRKTSLWKRIVAGVIGTKPPVPKPAPESETKQAPTVKAPVPQAEPTPRIVQTTVPEIMGQVLTQKERARALFEAGYFHTLNKYRRQQKKGWKALGFSDNEITAIKNYTEDNHG